MSVSGLFGQICWNNDLMLKFISNYIHASSEGDISADTIHTVGVSAPMLIISANKWCFMYLDCCQHVIESLLAGRITSYCLNLLTFLLN